MDSARRETISQPVPRLQAAEIIRPQEWSTHFGLDGLLPEGGLPSGSLVELLSNRDGVGIWTLALLMGWHACGERRSLAVADPERCFYPPAAALKLGIDLARLIVIRPATWGDAYIAIEQSLRCPAVGAVIGRCKRLRSADGRRFQLAAEAGGGLGLLLRSEETQAAPSFAALRLRLTPLEQAAQAGASKVGVPGRVTPVSLGSRDLSVPSTRLVRVEVLRCRGGQSGRSLVLEFDDETGHVRVPAALAAPAARAQ
jgi:protein ImuA